MSHEWGNYPAGFTPKMYWGARAIIERNHRSGRKALFILPDRQSFEQLEGSRADKDDFICWINEKVIPELNRCAGENRFHVWDDIVTLRSDSGIFMCQATPKSSGGGYLYIGCWEVE